MRTFSSEWRFAGRAAASPLFRQVVQSVQHHAPATPLRTPRQRTRPPCCTRSIGYNKRQTRPSKGQGSKLPVVVHATWYSFRTYCTRSTMTQFKTGVHVQMHKSCTELASRVTLALGAGYCTLQALDHGSTLTEQCVAPTSECQPHAPYTRASSMSSGLCEVFCDTKVTSSR